MKRSIVAVIGIVLLLALSPLTTAADEPLSPEALQIANSLNCPICSGESVRDSQASIALEMRQLIQQKLDQGQTPEQIRQYFVERYGVSILRDPPRQGFFGTLWWMPVVGVLFGAGVVVLYFASRQRREADPPVDPDELRRYEEQVGQELMMDQGL